MLLRIRALLVFLLILFSCSGAFADLAVHFLDVGQGDATVILCGNEAMLRSLALYCIMTTRAFLG